jgi:hypothetical protein
MLDVELLENLHINNPNNAVPNPISDSVVLSFMKNQATVLVITMKIIGVIG